MQVPLVEECRVHQEEEDQVPLEKEGQFHQEEEDQVHLGKEYQVHLVEEDQVPPVDVAQGSLGEMVYDPQLDVEVRSQNDSHSHSQVGAVTVARVVANCPGLLHGNIDRIDTRYMQCLLL